jgi:hypothetical protein
MNVVTLDGYILVTLLMIVTVGSIWMAGWLAERRGRSFRTWAWIGAIIGPLALPLLYLFPARKNGGAA